MDGSLEYLMCSLPHLSFSDGEAERALVSKVLTKYAGPVNATKRLDAILEDEADRFLSPNASKLFRSIDLTTIHQEAFRNSSNAVLSAFAGFMYRIKQDLCDLRQARRENLPIPQRGISSLSLTPGNPLQQEVQLLKHQWKQLEEMAIERYTDLGALIIYKLKLQVLLRWWSFDEQRGFEAFMLATKESGYGR